jgi:hypothetical protein
MLVFTSNNKDTTVTASVKNMNAGIRLSMHVEGPIKTKRKGSIIYVSDDNGLIGTVVKRVSAWRVIEGLES